MSNFVFIIGIVFFCISCFLFKKSYDNGQEKILQQKISKNEELSKINQHISEQTEKLLSLQKRRRKNEDQYKQLLKERQKTISSSYQKIEREQQQKMQKNLRQIQLQYKKEEERLQKEVQFIQQNQKQAQSKLDQLKKVYEEATAARLRQLAKQDELSFYKIKITKEQASDINILQEWKQKLYDPSIVSKVIWSAYIMKPTSDMCNRVLGTNTICGIYKITNKLSGDIYVGQSVNIADRWKQHVKCGLGIDASPTNKLYNNMQNFGVWNFTFEVLQKCPRDKLNEKERFWIDMYKANKIGLNTQGGNKK